MKTMKLYVLALVMVLAGSLACKKENNNGTGTQPTTEISTANQLSVTDDQTNDAIANALDAADGAEDGNADMSPTVCPVVTGDTIKKTITIDFGTSCLSPVSGRSRSGKIVIGYTGTSYPLATQRTLQFINFRSVDSITLNGTFTMSNISRTSNSINYTLTTSDFTFLYSDGKTHTLTAFSRTYSVNQGSNLRDITDNVTTINGGTTGINKEGETYTVTIVNPVVIKGECIAQKIFYPAAGSYDVKIGNKPKYTFSWGSNTCDKVISITFLGATTDITLP